MTGRQANILCNPLAENPDVTTRVGGMPAQCGGEATRDAEQAARVTDLPTRDGRQVARSLI
jgi:hypothetical protein